MNLPAAIDTSSALGSLHGPVTQSIGLAISSLVALVFMAYLVRCYIQEFRRHQRVRRRKRLARLKALPLAMNRNAVVEDCRRRRDLLMARETAALVLVVDWRAPHCLIPARDRVTLVWDTGRTNHEVLPRVQGVNELGRKEPIAGDGEPLMRELAGRGPEIRPVVRSSAKMKTEAADRNRNYDTTDLHDAAF